MTVYYEVRLEGEERAIQVLFSFMERAFQEGRALRWTLDGPARSPIRLRCEWEETNGASAEVHTCIFIVAMKGEVLLTDPSEDEQRRILFIGTGDAVVRLLIEPSASPLFPLVRPREFGLTDPGLSWDSLAEQ